MPRQIYIKFWKHRSCVNRIYYVIYGLFRFLVVTVWFYFVPFVALACSFIVPLVSIRLKEQETVEPTTP